MCSTDADAFFSWIDDAGGGDSDFAATDPYRDVEVVVPIPPASTDTRAQALANVPTAIVDGGAVDVPYSQADFKGILRAAEVTKSDQGVGCPFTAREMAVILDLVCPITQCLVRCVVGMSVPQTGAP